jgi:hypothetical protein
MLSKGKRIALMRVGIAIQDARSQTYHVAY